MNGHFIGFHIQKLEWTTPIISSFQLIKIYVNNPAQFLGVKFKKFTKVTKIATQGRPNVNQWVKSYTLAYSLDGITFTSYKVNGRTKVIDF